MNRASEHTLLESKVPFAESILWSLQRQYFEEMGMEAWRQGEVPHYITSNPRHANAYAELIIALYRDYSRNARPEKKLEPIRILELGGGSGRMAYYILRQLETLARLEGIPISAFQYILTDFAPATLEFWSRHPMFAPYFESGLLDIALLDAVHPEPVVLKYSHKVLGVEGQDTPMVVVANYLFDSIPQELLYFDEGQCQRVAVTSQVAGDPKTMTAAEILHAITLKYAPHEAPIDDPQVQPIIDLYCATFSQAYAMIPVLGIRCLEYLRNLAPHALLVLTADKGNHHLRKIGTKSPPGFSAHGSISMSVNYHALCAYSSTIGGWHYFADHGQLNIHTGCLLLTTDHSKYPFLMASCRKHLDESGPDTYYTIYKALRANLATMELRHLMAALRLGLYDSHQLGIYLPRISEVIAGATPSDIEDLIQLLRNCWDNYFPLAEDRDLALAIGNLCYAMDAYPWALEYFSKSVEIYGEYSGTLYNMAVCHHMMEHGAQAVALLQRVVAFEPQNTEAQALLATYTIKSIDESPSTNVKAL